MTVQERSAFVASQIVKALKNAVEFKGSVNLIDNTWEEWQDLIEDAINDSIDVDEYKNIH